jgi:DNA-binding transcriptional MerR regulator
MTSHDFAPRHSPAILQLSLFKATRDEFVAKTTVSPDEMRRWHTNGWISIDPAEQRHYDEKDVIEVEFIKGLARSGLSDAMIDRVLSSLEKPYCYEPRDTFYSFCEGIWFGPPRQPPPEKMAEESIEELIAGEEWPALRRLSARLSNALAVIDSSQNDA